MYLWSDLGGLLLIKYCNYTKWRWLYARLRPVIHRLMGCRLVTSLAGIVRISLTNLGISPLISKEPRARHFNSN
jgi:hypothetical protein